MGGVVGDVGEVDAEADHGRLVADRRDALDRARRPRPGRGRRPRSARRAVEVVRPLAVGGRAERVEHADLGPAREQRVDDVGADEAGAAGDEDRPARRARL